MIRQVLTAAFLWAPMIALWVLIGFAFSWWLSIVLAAGSAILVLWVIYRRRPRRMPSDPDAERAREERVDRRSVRWTKIWGLSLAGMMIFLFVLALVLLIVARV